jgi:hypothetical protein
MNPTETSMNLFKATILESRSSLPTAVVYLYFDRLCEWRASRKERTFVSPQATLSVPDAI